MYDRNRLNDTYLNLVLSIQHIADNIFSTSHGTGDWTRASIELVVVITRFFIC